MKWARISQEWKRKDLLGQIQDNTLMDRMIGKGRTWIIIITTKVTISIGHLLRQVIIWPFQSKHKVQGSKVVKGVRELAAPGRARTAAKAVLEAAQDDRYHHKKYLSTQTRLLGPQIGQSANQKSLHLVQVGNTQSWSASPRSEGNSKFTRNTLWEILQSRRAALVRETVSLDHRKWATVMHAVMWDLPQL